MNDSILVGGVLVSLALVAAIVGFIPVALLFGIPGAAIMLYGMVKKIR